MVFPSWGPHTVTADETLPAAEADRLLRRATAAVSLRRDTRVMFRFMILYFVQWH